MKNMASEDSFLCNKKANIFFTNTYYNDLPIIIGLIGCNMAKKKFDVSIEFVFEKK